MAQGFKGHQDHGAYAGDYVYSIKQAVQAGRAATGGSGGNFDQLTRYQSNEKMKNAWDKGDVSLTMGLVPDKYKKQAEEYIQSRAAELGRLNIEIQKMREAGNTQEPLYNELRMQASSIDQELGPDGVFTANWDKFNKMAQEHSENGLSGAYSETSNDAEDELLYSDFFSNSLDLQIGEGASLNFGNNELGFSNFQDLKPLNLSAYKDGNKLLNQMENVFNKGEVLSPNRELFYGNSFNEMIKEGGSNTLLSLAFDPLYGPGVDADGGKGGILRRNQWEQQIADIKSGDPTLAARATDELKKATHDAYMKMLKDQAQAGYDEKNPAATSGGWTFENDNYSNNTFDTTAYETLPDGEVGVEKPEGFVYRMEDPGADASDDEKDKYNKNKAFQDYEQKQYVPLQDDISKKLNLLGKGHYKTRFSGKDKNGQPTFKLLHTPCSSCKERVYDNYSIEDIQNLVNVKKK